MDKRMEQLDILLVSVRQLELVLVSYEFNQFVKKQSDDVKNRIRSYRTSIFLWKNQIENEQIEFIADKFYVLGQDLQVGISELHEQISKASDFIKSIETITRIVGLLSQIITMTPIGFGFGPQIMATRRKRNIAESILLSSFPDSIRESVENSFGSLFFEEKIRSEDEEKVVTLETPRGNKITLAESERVISLADENGNKIIFDTSGIKIESSKDIVLKSSNDIKTDERYIELEEQKKDRTMDLLFKQDGSNLLITVKGHTTKGLLIVQTTQKESKDEIVLMYRKVYNCKTMERCLMDFQVTWELKNMTQGNQKFTVQELDSILLTPYEINSLVEPVPHPPQKNC